MTHLASRTALAFLAVFAAVGCALPGERAETGVCPTGETCSTQAPDGLFFLGASTSDSFGGTGVATTAVGGTQTVEVFLSNDADSSSAFNQDFDAVTADPKVIEVSSIAPPNLVVAAGSVGATSLRLLESGTDKLLDRISVEAAEIEDVTLFPQSLFLLAGDELKGWALLSGSKTSVVVRLASATSDRLIDEKLSLTPGFGKATAQAWDMFEVTAPDAGEASFTVNAGKGSFPLKAPIVKAIDEIVTSEGLGHLEEDGKIEALMEQSLCFLSKSGGLVTVGAEWKFVGSSTLTIKPVDEGFQGRSSCVTVTGTEVGPAKLTVEASGFSKVVDIELVKKSTRSARFVAARPKAAASAGERAGGD